ncbi:MAG: ribosome silencing factor [Nitriliruptorales bacterium]
MPATDEAISVAVSACRAADDKQATDLTLLDVADLLALVDLFVIVSARTDRHLKAVHDGVEDTLRTEHGRKPLRREGTPDAGWILLDYGDVVVHLFDEDQRNFYSLERLWADVPQLEPLSGEALTQGGVVAR